MYRTKRAESKGLIIPKQKGQSISNDNDFIENSLFKIRLWKCICKTFTFII